MLHHLHITYTQILSPNNKLDLLHFNKNTVISLQFESIQILNNVTLLESSLKRILRTNSTKGYADLKPIADKC